MQHALSSWPAIAAGGAGVLAGAALRHVELLIVAACLLAAAAGALWLRLARATRRHRAEIAEWGREQSAREEEARRKDKFFARMSHELRSPMNGIVASAEMLLYTELTPEQRRHGETITESAEAMLRLIGDILDFSKIENGKLTLEEVAFSPRNVIRGVTDLLRSRAERQGLELRLRVSDHLPLWVRGDPSRLRQVLVNLTDNAVKFTRQGYVEVTAEPLDERPGGRWIRIAVSDTGIGLSAAEQAGIFEAYQQADVSTARNFGGTGLGLAICRELVELMGGRIGVASETGAGSTFWLEVPFAIPQSQGVAPERPAEIGLHAPERGSYRLLVADDNPVNQVVAQRLLETLGYQTDVAAHGLEVLAQIERRRYDLVLLDCQMPELDGYETAREIRRREGRGPRLPIIAVTADALAGDREKCLSAGMDDYVEKPFSSRDLAALIDRCLGLGRLDPTPALGPPAAADANPAVEILSEVLDRRRLAELAKLDDNGRGEWLIDVVEGYARQTPLRVGRAREALSTGDAEGALQAFHVLAGSSDNVGATRLAVESRRLEELIRAGDLAACRARMDNLESEWRQLSVQLEGAVVRWRPSTMAAAAVG